MWHASFSEFIECSCQDVPLIHSLPLPYYYSPQQPISWKYWQLEWVSAASFATIRSGQSSYIAVLCFLCTYISKAFLSVRSRFGVLIRPETLGFFAWNDTDFDVVRSVGNRDDNGNVYRIYHQFSCLHCFRSCTSLFLHLLFVTSAICSLYLPRNDSDRHRHWCVCTNCSTLFTRWYTTFSHSSRRTV